MCPTPNMSKTVLITGANRGIGLGLVKILCKKDFRVLATCRDPASATELRNILENSNHPEPIALDVADDASIEHLRKYLESNQLSVHHLINNAGVASKTHPHDPPDNVDREDALRLFNINVCGVSKVTQASGVLRSDNKGGKVINISSRQGSISSTLTGASRGIPASRGATYKASKAAQNMLTACLALEHPHLIFLMVSPGWVQTDMGGAGGRTADLSVEESAEGVIRVMEEASPEMTGKFVDWQGKEIPF